MRLLGCLLVYTNNSLSSLHGYRLFASTVPGSMKAMVNCQLYMNLYNNRRDPLKTKYSPMALLDMFCNCAYLWALT